MNPTDHPKPGPTVETGMRRHLLVAFGLALGLYIVAFSVDQHLRTRRGPWVVDFTRSPTGAAALRIDQPALGITNLVITLRGEIAPASGIVRFDRPQVPVPFGKTLFEDLTYLPGTVTLELFGHQLELIPRTLNLDGKEIPWASNLSLEVGPEQKPPPRPPPKPKGPRPYQ